MWPTLKGLAVASARGQRLGWPPHAAPCSLNPVAAEADDGRGGCALRSPADAQLRSLGTRATPPVPDEPGGGVPVVSFENRELCL
ncbi:hypothetical protein GCM10010151_71110 [Actinoallomurus spadix]|uniref:Secreted protein n=1 Tax=Actinoallomurus spadix TaxID=79912 RepID=A0ABN0XRF2_9ACTN